MLPILTTIGAGLAWLGTAIGQTALWGFGVSIGWWVGKKFSDTWDFAIAKYKANKAHQKRFPEDGVTEVIVTKGATNPA